MLRNSLVRRSFRVLFILVALATVLLAARLGWSYHSVGFGLHPLAAASGSALQVLVCGFGVYLFRPRRFPVLTITRLR